MTHDQAKVLKNKGPGFLPDCCLVIRKIVDLVSDEDLNLFRAGDQSDPTLLPCAKHYGSLKKHHHLFF